MMNILYLLNHKILTDFEVPILIKNNMYCFIPKIYKSLDNEQSINYASNYFYDNFSDIYTNDIIHLNQIDWFNKDLIIDKKTIDIINTNFKCIFLTLLTSKNMLLQLINNFKGTIYFRFFGLSGDRSYLTIMEHVYGDLNTNKIKYIFSYNEIIEHENKINNHFTNSSFYVPLGLSNSLINKIHNSYNPINNKIAFVCSRTDETKYYQDIYNKFTKEFIDFEFIIFGKNNTKIQHLQYVKNNLDDDNYYAEISKCACMFYHSKEPRHLHYHPLEAIVIGMPVIFYKESLLSSYLNDSPGKCNDLNDVKCKIRKIINGDNKFVSEILTEQNKIIHLLTIKHNMNIFDKVFDL